MKFKFISYNNDYEFIFNEKKVCFKKYVEENYGEWNDKQQYKLLDKFIEESKNQIQIIVVNGKKVGFTNGKDIDENNYVLGNLCLLPEYQNKGIGTAILKEVISKNKNKNIILHVFKQNCAQELYKRLGFEIFDETESHYKMIFKRTIVI